jgi:hypothetical protein
LVLEQVKQNTAYFAVLIGGAHRIKAEVGVLSNTPYRMEGVLLRTGPTIIL